MPPKKGQKRPQKNDINHKCKIRKCKAGDSSKSKCKELVFDPTLQTKDNFANCCNIVNILDGIQRSNKSFYSVRKACRNVLINKISRLSVYKRESPFDRRVTVIEWHPKNPRLLAAASKGGDILLWNYEKFTPEQLIVGLGPGGSVQAIKFHPENEVEFYTASIDGQVVSRNFQDRTCKIFLETQDFDKWYTSLDVSIKNRHIVAGDNTGYLTMLSLEGEQLSKTRLHKNKITHAEFNVKQPWLLTTASIDRTVKLWDIRHLTKDALTVLHHDYGVNSAYFR
ncbi:hypothetical protein C0J52_22072 [Blattella germanica]|nr:hypothetical protein C0J52_22072 [Blattella germanica]